MSLDRDALTRRREAAKYGSEQYQVLDRLITAEDALAKIRACVERGIPPGYGITAALKEYDHKRGDHKDCPESWECVKGPKRDYQDQLCPNCQVERRDHIRSRNMDGDVILLCPRNVFP